MMLTGKMPAVANTGTSMVDVRDVALAHIRALTVPEAAGHRHIVNWDCVMFPDVAQVENSRFPRNNDIPRNIRAKLGGSPEYWGESRNIGGISEEVGCFKIHK